jgi:hypothetical protein
MAIDINNIPTGAIPPEIQKAFTDFLKVEGRITFPLKPTKTSAVSTSAAEPDGDGVDAEKEVNDLINSVDELENLVEQLEDMADQLTKDMNIPVPADNAALKKAVQQLGGDDAITREVYDTALAIIDTAPLMTFRQDPVTAALTGDGHIDGPWFECSQVTSQAADLFNLRPGGIDIPETPVLPKNDEILDDFEGNLLEMILHILLMLWWNMIWPKFLVDLAIINPPRKIVAIPIDGLIFFFKSVRWNGRRYRTFKKKPSALLEEKGPINTLLNELRKILLCKVPPKLWNRKDYDPIVEIDCEGVDDECPGKSNPGNNSGPDGLASDEVSSDGFDILSDEPCVTSDDFIENVDRAVPENLGMGPECLQAATRVANYVQDDVYSPRSPGAEDPTLQTDLGVVARENFGV